MKLSKKHFGRIAIFHSKNLLGEAPKNLKKSLTTKRNIKKTMWQNRLIPKKIIIGETLQ